MMEKIEFSHPFWKNDDTQLIADLIGKLWEEKDNDNIILDIDDLVRENDERMPVLYGIIPYIVEIAVNKEAEEAIKIWTYLGCWVYNQNLFRTGIDTFVLKCFDEALKNAEVKLCEYLSKGYKLNESDLEYLYACLFAFAGHDFGCIVVDPFRDYEEGAALARCPNGHLNEFAVYDNGIFLYDEKERKRGLPAVPMGEFAYPLEKEQQNSWKILMPLIDNRMQTETSSSIKSHLKIAAKVLEQGVTGKLPMRFAFSVYGSLLYCNGCINSANRFFHGWDEVVCPVCGEKYVFADYWCDC